MNDKETIEKASKLLALLDRHLNEERCDHDITSLLKEWFQ